MHRELVQHTISSALFLERLFGNYGCGLAALEAYFSDNPEVTADYISARLDNYQSEDTCRRRLNEMAKAGIVHTRREGRTVLYTLNKAHAEAAIQFLKGDPIELPASKVA